jgi:site-specific recombinase XerD
MVLSTEVLAPGISLRSLASAFILTKQTEVKSPRTIEFYTDNLRRFLWYAENEGWSRDIQDITTWHIRAFLGYVSTEKHRWGLTGNGSETSKHQVSYTTVHHYYNVLKAFFSWVVQEGFLPENIMDNIRLSRVIPKIIKPYSLNEIRRILAICEYDFTHNSRFLGSRNRALVLILLDTGLRLSEILAMTLRDVTNSTGYIQVMGKGRVERTVRMGKVAQEAVATYLEYRPVNGRNELWLTEEGGRLRTTGLQSMVKRLKQRAGVDSEGSIHRFRHTFALEFLRRDKNVFNLQYLLGHSDLEMVRRYTRTLGMEDALKAHEQASPADFLTHEG